MSRVLWEMRKGIAAYVSWETKQAQALMNTTVHAVQGSTGHGSWWTSTSGNCALKAQTQTLLLVEISFPPTLLHPKVPIPYPTRTIHGTSLFFQFSMEVLFFFPLQATHVEVFLPSASALATVTQVPLLPPPLGKLTRAVGRKGEEILEVGRKKSLLQTAFYWERFSCSKLHWEADLVQLLWGLNRFFSGWQPKHICKIFSGEYLYHSKLP